MDIIKSIEHEQMKSVIPNLKVGDTVRVHQRIKEGNRERIQVFEGIIIKKQGGGLNATFTVRRVAYGCGVEKTFLIHSPMVEKIEVVRIGKARRAKLYYLRDRVGKSARTKEDIGARIETNEIVIKSAEVEETPVVEDVSTEESVVAEEIAVEENVADVVDEAPTTAEVIAKEINPTEEPAVDEATEAVAEEVVEVESKAEEVTTTEPEAEKSETTDAE